MPIHKLMVQCNSKKYLFIIIIFILLAMQIFARETEKPSIIKRFDSIVKFGAEKNSAYYINENTKEALSDSMLYSTLANIKTSPRPFAYGKNFVFVFKKDEISPTDRIFIAFEDELYLKLHPFIPLESNPYVTVFLLPRTHIDQRINYRIIINSIWTIDPNNPDVQIDAHGIQISTVFVPKLNPIFLPPVVTLDNETIRFYLYMNVNYSPIRDTRRNLIDMYNTNLFSTSIFLVGTFTNWDPYLIKMKPVEGVDLLYYADVPVSAGVHHYYYNAGAISFLDPHNEAIAKRHTGGVFVNKFRVTPSVEEITGDKTFVLSTMDK